METTPVFELFGKIAGIGGLGLAVALVVFRDVIAKNIFPQLQAEQAYRLLRLMIVFTFLLGLCGIAAWVWSNSTPKPATAQGWPAHFEDLRSAEIIVSDVDDQLDIAVNGQALPPVLFGAIPGPIAITPLLHRGTNQLRFTVMNGPYGGCGAQVDIILNGAKDADHHWEWFRDIAGTCANCVCFEFNKTVYLP